MSMTWSEDLCKTCPYSDMCYLVSPEETPNGCVRMGDWRDAQERQQEGER
jgi:hypothetical protein